MSPEVRQVLGEEAARNLINKPPFQNFQCLVCGKTGKFEGGKPLSISLEIAGNTVRTRITHAHCAPSEVIRLPEGALNDRISDIAAKRVIWGVTPAFVFGPDPPTFGMTEAGELHDAWLEGFKEMGFVVATNGAPKDPLAGWRLEVSDLVYTLCDPTGRTVVVRFTEPATPWLDALWRYGACLAVTGSTIFNEPGELDEDRLRKCVTDGKAVVAVIKAVQRD